MAVDQYILASTVVAVLNRLASVEARLSREADAAGDETLGLVHEHGEMCLREASRAIEGLAGE